MPLLKEDKKKLAKQYVANIEWATNAVVLSYKGIPVNEMNAVRMDIADAHGKLQSVKKRVLAKWVEKTLEGLHIDDIDDSLMLLYSNNEEDQHAPLKVIHKHTKAWKKDKLEFGFDYVGGWYDKLWQSADYIKELAALPSKEELLGKLAFLLNYPITSFARGLQAIADKDGGEEIENSETPEVSERKEEVKEENKEEVKENTSVETEQAEENSEEATEEQSEEK